MFYLCNKKMQTLKEQAELLGAIKSIAIPCIDTTMLRFRDNSYHIVDIYPNMIVCTSDFTLEELGEDGYEETEASDKTIMRNINGVQQTYNFLHERDSVVVYSYNLQWEVMFEGPEEAREFFDEILSWCKSIPN